jgi:hypothetical protein
MDAISDSDRMIEDWGRDSIKSGRDPHKLRQRMFIGSAYISDDLEEDLRW